MPSPVEDIKSRLSAADVVGSYVRLVKAGQNFKALCPFHNEKTPSFYVSPARDIWHCFGCSKGGDIFAFIKEIEGVDFPEALELLASRAGVILKKEDPRLLTERRRHFFLLEEAAKFYEAELAKRRDVLDYLKERGLKEETIKSFRLGYAPQSWDGALAHLRGMDFRAEEAERAGLAIISQNPEARSRFYDRFRGRIMFPIADGAGRTIGFSGRIYEKDLPKNESPENAGGKYINTPNTLLFDKSRVLYLWDRAKNEIRQSDACILVEGQMDALMSHQAGIRNVVATSGTALGQGHLNLIRRLTSKLFLAFDADAAGELATKRGVDMVLSSGFDVHIMEVPGGKDPADAIRANPELWAEAAREAKPVISFFLGILQKHFSSDPRKLKSETGKLVLPYIAALENEMERAHWVQETSKVLGIKEEPIWEEVKKLRLGGLGAKITSVAPDAPVAPAKSRRDLLEERVLGMLVWKRGEFLEKLKATARDFFSEHHKPLLECVFNEKIPAGGGKIKRNLEKLALEAELLYGEMPARNASRSEAGGEKVHEEFHLLLAELEKEHLKARLGTLAAEIRELETSGEEQKIFPKLTEFKELSQKLSNHNVKKEI